MRTRDMKRAVELLANEWNLGKRESGAEGNICAWIYLMEILEETERIVTYIENNKLIGLCGYSNDKSNKHLLKKNIYKIIKKLLYNSPKIKDKNALKEYYNNYNYLPKELEGYFDGEVSILIVDKEYRGKNIGRKLLYETFELARNDNMKNLQILSDESCSYEFYEKCGCEKVYETIVKNQEYGKLGIVQTEKAYIYEKKLGEMKNETY